MRLTFHSWIQVLLLSLKLRILIKLKQKLTFSIVRTKATFTLISSVHILSILCADSAKLKVSYLQFFPSWLRIRALWHNWFSVRLLGSEKKILAFVVTLSDGKLGGLTVCELFGDLLVVGALKIIAKLSSISQINLSVSILQTTQQYKCWMIITLDEFHTNATLIYL